MMLLGVNLTGSEVVYGQANTDNPVSGQDFLFVSRQDIDYLVNKKINFARVLLSWEVLQPQLNGPIVSNSYTTTLEDRVNYLTSKGVTVMLEIHSASNVNFTKYKGNLIGSAAVPNSSFADFWSKIALKFKSNAKVIFGLINEPTGISTVSWFNAAQAAVLAIRATGATNMIMVPGNGFTSASGWTFDWYDIATPKVSNANAWSIIKDPLNNTVCSVHMYLDPNAGGGTEEIDNVNMGVQRLTALVNWARLNGVKVHLGEFAASSNNPLSTSAIKNIMDFILANSDVMIGAAWWAYGPPAWWGTYKFTLCPSNNYTKDDVKWSWLSSYLSNLIPVDTSPPATGPVTSVFLNTTYDNNGFFKLNSGFSDYIGYKPDTYSSTKPMSLFIWMHGCGGNAEGDMWTICPPATRSTQSYIAISLGGRDGACWQQAIDSGKVLSAITHVSKYFNIDQSKIYLGGYSSGGDMTYYVGMQNAEKFAGLLICNSDAGGSGLTVEQLIPKASWKINIAQLNHLSDLTYPISQARSNLSKLRLAGFPVFAEEKVGNHYDQSVGTTGTSYNIINTLLPYLNKGWKSNTITTLPPTLTNFSKTTVVNKYPGDQGFTANKIVPSGYSNVASGTYSLGFATRVTYSGNDVFCVNIIISNDNVTYDISWDELQLDCRSHVLLNSNQCTTSANTGVITVKPTDVTKKIESKNKTSISLCFTRATGLESNYQVLIKSVKI